VGGFHDFAVPGIPIRSIRRARTVAGLCSHVVDWALETRCTAWAVGARRDWRRRHGRRDPICFPDISV